MTPNPLLLHLGLAEPFPVPAGRVVTQGKPHTIREEVPDHVTPEMLKMRGICLNKGFYVVKTQHMGKAYMAGRFKHLCDAEDARDELEAKLGKTITVQVRKAARRAGT